MSERISTFKELQVYQLACEYGYVEEIKHAELDALCLSIGRKLGKMMQMPESFI